MMQSLANAYNVDDRVTREPQADPAAVAAVLAASRTLIAEILGRFPVPAQRKVAEAFRGFADAAGGTQDCQWPELAVCAEERS
jgi:hypothetical protein